MKKMMMTLMAMLTIAVSANAMSYEQARNEALFLTDKMAYELNLTDEQYEAAYEINLDYLMGITGRADVYGPYWEHRNLDLSYILYDWQWNAYLAASYFYRPLYWDAGYWHFGIYARYPHRDYFYFGRPHFYATYRGGHAWHAIGGHGYYYGRRDVFRAPRQQHFGMHDRWQRGDFRSGHPSSTRVTAGNNRGRIENNRGRGTINYGNRGTMNDRNRGTMNDRNRGTMDNGSRGNGRNVSGSRNNGGSFSGSRSNGGSSAPSRNFGSSSSSSRNFGSSSSSSRSSSSHSSSMSVPSRSSSSHSSSMSTPSRSINSHSSSSISGPSRSSSSHSSSMSIPSRSSGSSSHSSGSVSRSGSGGGSHGSLGGHR